MLALFIPYYNSRRVWLFDLSHVLALDSPLLEYWTGKTCSTICYELAQHLQHFYHSKSFVAVADLCALVYLENLENPIY